MGDIHVFEEADCFGRDRCGVGRSQQEGENDSDEHVGRI